MIDVYFQERLPGLPRCIFQKMTDHLERSLQKQKEWAGQELDKLEADRKRAVKTRNRAFPEQSAQKAMASFMRAKASEDDQAPNSGGINTWATPRAFPQSGGPGTSRQIAEKLAEDMLIIYEVGRHW